MSESDFALTLLSVILGVVAISILFWWEPWLPADLRRWAHLDGASPACCNWVHSALKLRNSVVSLAVEGHAAGEALRALPEMDKIIASIAALQQVMVDMKPSTKVWTGKWVRGDPEYEIVESKDPRYLSLMETARKEYANLYKIAERLQEVSLSGVGTTAEQVILNLRITSDDSDQASAAVKAAADVMIPPKEA